MVHGRSFGGLSLISAIEATCHALMPPLARTIQESWILISLRK